MPSAESTLGQLRERLLTRLGSAKPFEQLVYRSSTPKYATETDLITGEGSKRQGGRWNPLGIAVVYASLTPETALAETLAHNRYYNLPIEDAMPRTFVALQVKTQCILDLTDGQVRQRLRFSLDAIRTVDWRHEMHLGRKPITHEIGQAAFEVGLEGLIVSSAADTKGKNLLIFPANLRPGSTVTVWNADQLKP